MTDTLTRYAIGAGGTVVAIVESPVAPVASDGGFVMPSDTADVGWFLVDGVLTSQNPAPTPLQLIEAVSAAQNAFVGTARGFAVGTANPVPADGTAQTIAYLLAIRAWPTLPTTQPTDVFRWWGPDGSITPLTPSEATAFADAVGSWILNVGNFATQAVLDVEAGTITSLAQVADLAWPTG